jgi:hypothetical protein
MSFLLNCLKPDAVLMLFVFASCLIGYGLPGYRGRTENGAWWLLWLIIGVLALISWVMLVVS